MVTLYSTPACAPCKVAEKRLDAAGIPFEKVDLTQHPSLVEDLKDRLDQPLIQTPIMEFRGELFGIADLSNIIRSIN